MSAGITEAFDATPQSKRTLFLAKPAFLLVNLVGDRDQVAQAIATAQRDL